MDQPNTALKAYFVYIPDHGGTFFHAKSRGKAKVYGLNVFYYDADFIEVCAFRVPRLDNEAFTFENVKPTGIYDDDDFDQEWWHNECCCELCEKDKK